MRVSVGVLVLALLGRAAGFAGITTARARQNAFKVEKMVKPSLREATPTRRLRPASWFQTATTKTTTMTAARGAGRALKASDQPAATSSSRPPLDVLAVAQYIAGTAAEFGIIMGLLTLLQGNVLPRLGAKGARATVFLTFGFLAMKSRTFAVLNARSPALPKEKEAKVERRRPDWMPPVKVFPVIWITIGILRAVSTTMVWEALGCNLATGPIAAMVLHLSIGDTWNHINNVEKKLGVAVSVVFVVWLSVANAAFRYYQTLPLAGLVLLPSLVWITVANLLVQAIWRLNGREPLYPPKQTA